MELTFSIIALAFFLDFIYGESINFKATLVCSDTHMNVYIKSAEDEFTGVVYTEGSYKVDGCHIAVDGSSKILFQIPYDSCKTVEENGEYTNVVIVQHHERIMTSDDAAFKLSCNMQNLKQSEVQVTKSIFMVHDSSDHEEKFSDTHSYGKKTLEKFAKQAKTILSDQDVITVVKMKNSNGTQTKVDQRYVYQY